MRILARSGIAFLFTCGLALAALTFDRWVGDVFGTNGSMFAVVSLAFTALSVPYFILVIAWVIRNPYRDSSAG
jgi:hypothetical protein